MKTKSYNVTVSVTFKKPMKINACCGDEAIAKTKDILFNTDIIEFTENDIASIVCEAESSAEKLVKTAMKIVTMITALKSESIFTTNCIKG